MASGGGSGVPGDDVELGEASECGPALRSAIGRGTCFFPYSAPARAGLFRLKGGDIFDDLWDE